jgi:hypothetical protein
MQAWNLSGQNLSRMIKTATVQHGVLQIKLVVRQRTNVGNPFLDQATGKRRKARPLTRFCQLCLKYSHCTDDCWVQEKNKEHCPLNWKGTCNEANNDWTATNAALVDDTLRRTADTLPLAQNDVIVEVGTADSE